VVSICTKFTIFTPWYEYHGIEMCDTKGVHSINMNMLIQQVMSQKVQLFAWAERKKTLMNPLKKNSTKHWLQQNWFVDVPKLSQMCHWSTLIWRGLISIINAFINQRQRLSTLKSCPQLQRNVVAFRHAKKQCNLQFTTHTLHHKKMLILIPWHWCL
jgi:hypothetical protein